MNSIGSVAVVLAVTLCPGLLGVRLCERDLGAALQLHFQGSYSHLIGGMMIRC